MTTKETDGGVTDHAESEISRDGGTSTAKAVAAKLQALEQMDYAALRREWRRLYRVHPPKRVARDLLLLGVAWKIQEQVYGGLGAATKRRLADLAKTMERAGDVTRDRVARLKPGVKLLREWRGQTHKVIVLEDGFEWKGRRWRSLSVIAREITGGHWSGPRFFGLNDRRRKQAEAGAGDPGDA
jgi:hypothetical protein